MICNQCGLQMYEGSWNCPRCGNVLNQQPYQNQGFAVQMSSPQTTPLQAADPALLYNTSPAGVQSQGVPSSAIESFGADPIAPAVQSFYTQSTQPAGFSSAQNMMRGGYSAPISTPAQQSYPQQTQPYGQPYGQPDYTAGQGGYPGYEQAPYSMGQPPISTGYSYAQASGAMPLPGQTPTPRMVPGDTGRIFLSMEEMKAAENEPDQKSKSKSKGLGWLITLIVLLTIVLILLLVFHFLSGMPFTPENIFTYYKELVMNLDHSVAGLFS